MDCKHEPWKGVDPDRAPVSRPWPAVTVGPADHRDQHAAVEQPLGDALHVGHGHGLDQAVALVDVIDAEIVELDLHELRGDLVEVSKRSA